MVTRHAISVDAAAPRLLVVSPREDTRRLLSSLLGDKAELDFAQGGDDALTALDRHGYTVLLFEEVPGSSQNSLAALAALNRRSPVTQLVLFGRQIGSELLGLAVNEVGSLKYLGWPIQPEVARQVLDRAFEDHRQAFEIARLLEARRSVMRGPRRRLFEIGRHLRIRVRFAREALISSTVIVLALYLSGFVVGVVLLFGLYGLKTALGIDLMAESHLGDWVNFW